MRAFIAGLQIPNCVSIVNQYKYKVEGIKLQTPILLNGDFLAFSLFFHKYAYIGSNSL